MRQAGFLAAAGLYAIEHNIKRLKEDNERARKAAQKTQHGVSWVKEVFSCPH
jgi:threonine aldolase